jgi:hypothetical protein
LVKDHEHRVKGGRGRWSGTAGAGDRALADRLGIAGGHPKPVSAERLAQRRPARIQLLRGRVNAAQPLGELEGAFGFGAG